MVKRKHTQIYSVKLGSQYDDTQSFRKDRHLSSICEHALYDETLRNERPVGVELDSILS